MRLDPASATSRGGAAPALGSRLGRALLRARWRDPSRLTSAFWLLVPALGGCPQLQTDDFTSGVIGPDAAGGEASSPPDGRGGRGGSASDGGSAGALGEAGGGTGGSAGLGGSGGAGAPTGGTCFDGARNQDEQEVDCGGTCPACPCAFTSFSAPELIGVLGTAGEQQGPSLSADGLTLFFSAQGASSEDIFISSRGNLDSPFSQATLLTNVNSGALDGSPSLTADGRTLFFFSDRSGGINNRDLWVSTRDAGEQAFGAPTLVPNVNSPDMDLLPELSPDQRTLFFVSTRDGGSGATDIWAAERAGAGGEFSAPVSRADLNTVGREEGLSLSRDGLTIVFSTNRGDPSNMDLWSASRDEVEAAFAPASPIEELASNADELDPELSADGRELIFVSARNGNRRLWHAKRGCE